MAQEENGRSANVVLIAGPITGHPKEAHEYEKAVTLIKHCLETSPNAPSMDLSANYRGWDAQARERLDQFVRRGGGPAVIHFANWAFHASLPRGETSDWPGYRKLVRRLWDHGGPSGHDPYGSFEVRVSQVRHPITDGLPSFQTEDELYFHQTGDRPVQALVYADSSVTGQAEPLAWAYEMEQGWVFQTLLGHASTSIYRVANLIQRGCTWAAGKEPLSFYPPAILAEGAMLRDGASWKP